MLTKNKIKLINSLSVKKNRLNYGLFVAEGKKNIEDLLDNFLCEMLFYISNVENKYYADCQEEITKSELNKISFLEHPQEMLAIFKMPVHSFNVENLLGKLTLVLDNIQDPGNLGTIIRIADWFGIENIICSIGTADAYSPKTVQATMGAIGRVKIFYHNLSDFFEILDNRLPIYGSMLDGEDIYSQCLSNEGIIVMGNEGNGISKEVEQWIKRRIFIPNYPTGRKTSDSLNVAVATAIVCSEFRRR